MANWIILFFWSKNNYLHVVIFFVVVCLQLTPAITEISTSLGFSLSVVDRIWITIWETGVIELKTTVLSVVVIVSINCPFLSNNSTFTFRTFSLDIFTSDTGTSFPGVILTFISTFWASKSALSTLPGIKLSGSTNGVDTILETYSGLSIIS